MKAIQKIKSNLSKIIIVLRHGILSLYSYIRKFVPWRSRTYIQNLRHVRIAGVTSSFLFGLLALAIIIPLYNVSGTEDTEAATGTAIDSSITFTSTRNTATVDLTPTSASGTFASSTSGTTDAAFSITTTNSQGYELKIKSTSGTVLKPTTTTSDSDGLSAISTSGITSSSFTNNTWGYLPNYYNCNEASGACTTNTTNYYPATTSDVTLRKTTSANNTAHNYTIGLGAKADLTKTSGTYTLGGNKGSLVLTYVANPTAYEIAYRDNSGDSTVTNMPTTTQSGAVSATSIALAPNRTPTRTGYSLTGWCLGEVTSAGTSCSGTTIATNGSLALDRTTSNSATLYAIWTPNKYTCTKQYRLQNADGTWGNYTTDTTEQVDYNSTCSYSKTVTNYKGSETGTNGSAATTSATMNSTNGITVQVSLWRNTFTVTKRYRKQDTSGNYPDTYTNDGTATVLYGANYTYSRAAETGFQAASTTASSVTANITLSLDVPRVTYTCSRQYRLQNADGSWGSYTADGSVTAYYGGSCSYSKTVTNYKGSSSGSNGSAGSASASNVTSDRTLSISFYRNTYTLTVSAGSNTSSATGGGTYRWGQTVTVGVTKASNTTCISYATPTWSRTSGSGTLNATSGTSVTFTMATSAATVTASSSASNVAQTVTLSRSTGASGINIAGTNYTGSSVSLNCGTYNISGNYSSNYEFSSWSRANGVAVANTSSASTTMTVNGAGTLTLNAKSSKLWFQNATSANCGSTMYDNRGNDTYKNIAYTTVKIGSLCWMNRNLDLPGGTKLTSSDSNVTSDYTLPASSTSGFSSESTAYVYNSSSTYNDTSCGQNDPCYSYYSYVAAAAGTNPSSGDATSDICPKGWRLPTTSDMYDMIQSGSSWLLNKVYSGYYYSSAFNQGGSQGSWWSSTAFSAYNAYHMFYSNRLSYTHNYKNRGYSIRCVAKS